MRPDPTRPAVELPTLVLYLVTLAVWITATSAIHAAAPGLGIILTGIAIAQYSSLQHEGLHGHPFRNDSLNELLLTPALTLTVPFGRFRDTHLAHHHDPILTDPYDDPESNFLDPAAWNRLAPPLRWLFTANNTLLGRMTLGPLVGNALWLKGELSLILAGNRTVTRDWLRHGLGLVPVVAWLWVSSMPWWAYLVSAWIGHGLLKIRTFLEHRAHETARARTVVVEDRGPLSILFLNNNYHAVHHMHPGVAWYDLPALYRSRRDFYLRRNEGYVFRSYAEVFARYFWHTKDPVPHPVWPVPKGGQPEAD